MHSIFIPHKRLFLFLIVLFEFSVYVSNDMILPAITAVYREFQEPIAQVPYSLGVFLLGCVAIQLFGGPYSDAFGRRKALFLGGILVFFGNLFAMLANNIHLFYLGRLFQGMGLCFIGVAGYAAVHELFEQKEAVRNMAWMSSVALFAPMLGPLLGTFLFLTGSWRVIFATTFVLNIMACVGLYFFMPESLPKNKRTPLHPSLLLASYRRLLYNRYFILSSILWGFILAALMIWISSSPLILMEIFHMDAFSFGLLQTPVFVSFILGTLFLRYLTKHCSVQECYKIGCWLVYSAALPIFFSAFTGKLTLVSLVVAESFFNFGIGVMSAPLNRLTIEASTEPKGISTSLFYFVTLGISSLAPMIFVRIYNGTVFLFTTATAVLLLLALVVQFFMQPKPMHQEKP